jgi:hypothetical protein
MNDLNITILESRRTLKYNCSWKHKSSGDRETSRKFSVLWIVPTKLLDTATSEEFEPNSKIFPWYTFLYISYESIPVLVYFLEFAFILYSWLMLLLQSIKIEKWRRVLATKIIYSTLGWYLTLKAFFIL